MRKFLILCAIVILSFFSCDLGMVKLMDKKEYGKETGKGVKDVEFSLSTGMKAYLRTKKIKVYINFNKDTYLNGSNAEDLEESIRNNLKLVNADLYSVSYNYDSENGVKNTDTKSIVTMTLIPNGVGNIEVTIPEKTICLPYDEDDYIDCYNKEASETLVIKPDLLYPYYEAGLQIGGVCSISSHEYVVFDTTSNKMFLIDSDNSSVIDEGVLSIFSIKKMKYCESENKIYVLEKYTYNLHIIDINTMTSTSTTIPLYISSGDNFSLKIDPTSRRIYIYSDNSKLYSLDMDDYSEKMNSSGLESYIDYIALDAANNLLYASKSNNTYKYSIASDTLSAELLHNSSSSQYHNGFTINSDGSKIYYSSSDEFYIINTSDLTETSFEISGYVVAILPEYDLYFTKKYSYPNNILGKYRISDHSLSSSRDLDIMDGYTINTDGTEALVYSRSYYFSQSCDVVNFVELE